MTIDELREMHRARPFNPFTLHLADGRHIHISHPEFLMQSKRGRTICVATTDGTFQIIDLMLVVSIESKNGEQAPS